MRRRIVLVGMILVLAVAALVTWKLRPREATSPAASASGSEADLVARKRAAHRSDAPTLAAAAGRVSRQADDAGLAGAVVSLAPRMLSGGIGMLDGDEVNARAIVLIADGEGRWSAAEVRPGRYTLTATSPGFLPAHRDEITLAPGGSADGLDLALAAGGVVVSGKVRDVNAGAISGARIHVERTEFEPGIGAFAALTRSDGSFELGLSDGSWEVTAIHGDYTKASQVFEVKSAPRFLELVLSPGGEIRGEVIARADGKPIPGAIVKASGGQTASAGDSDTIEATADSNGHFVLHGLGSGGIALDASGRGYASRAPTIVELGIGEQVDSVKVVVDSAFAISGSVVSAARPDQGLTGVTVAGVALGATAKRMSAVTSPDGSFELVGVLPGKHLLLALSEDSNFELAQPVTVTDRDVADLVFEMKPGSTLAGRLSEPSSARLWLEVENAKVGMNNLLDVVKARLVHGEADESGVFELSHVPLGSFVLRAHTDDGREGTLLLTVSRESQSALVIPLERRAAASGRVVDAAGAPVEGLTVKVTGKADEAGFQLPAALDRGAGTAITGVDGRFRVTGLTPGKHELEVRDARGTLAWADEAHLARPRAPIEIQINGADDVNGLLFTVENRDGVIAGVVHAADGRPQRDAWVTAKRAGPGEAETPVLSDGDGRFAIAHLRNGTYIVTTESGRSRARKEEVRPGDTVSLTLEPLGSLSGVVRRGNDLVTDYDVRCDGPAGRTSRHVIASDATYRMERLPSGKYSCTVIAGAGVASGQSAVEAGKAAVLDLTLGDWGSLRGRVVDAMTGQAISSAFVLVTGDTVDQSQFVKGLASTVPSTDADGRFVVERVGAGKVSVVIIEGSLASPIFKVDVTLGGSGTIDLGTIAAMRPQEGDPGSLGFLQLQMDGHTTKEAPAISLHVEVTKLVSDGAAAAAGVRQGDVIVSIDGRNVNDLGYYAVSQLLAQHAIAGRTYQLGIKRGRSTRAVPVTARAVDP